MRIKLSWLAISLLCVAVARADEVETPMVKHPTEKQWSAIWPRDAAGKFIFGEAQLACAALPDGALASCEVLRETPANQGIAAAALKLIPYYRRDIADRSGLLPDGRAALNIGRVFDTGPEWLKKPTFDQLLAVYPAKGGGRDGGAVLRCTVMTDGAPKACIVKKESPPGLGFGDAALALTSSMVFRPALRAGAPVEAEISLPVNFSGWQGLTDGPEIYVLSNPSWKAVPTMADLLAAFPSEARKKTTTGWVSLQCSVNKTGHLKDCLASNVFPESVGLESKADELSKKFLLDLDAIVGKKREIRVNIRIQFIDPDNYDASNRYVDQISWKSVIDQNKSQVVYPASATKADIHKGTAVVDCKIGAAGEITDCTVVRESAAGFGFGDTAKAIASVMVANLWTKDGLPVEGARLRLPVSLVEPAATTEAPAKP